MSHSTLFPEALQKAESEEGEAQPHIAILSHTHIDGTIKTIKDDEYPSLDKNYSKIKYIR